MEDVATKILDHKFIVFGRDGINTLGVIRALGEAGIRPYLVLWTRPELSKYSKYVQECYLSFTLEKGFQYILSKFGEEKEKPFIFATEDESVSCLDLHYDEIKDKFYFYNAGEQGRLTKLMEKGYLPQLAESCGLRIPRTEEVRNGELPTTLSYPVITKSPTSTIFNWKSNVHVCYNEEELLQAFKQINKDRVVIQEYIEKVDEIDYEGFVINDGKDLYMPLNNRYYRLEEDSYGNYAYIERNPRPELLEPIKKLVEKTGYNGIFEMEFLVGKNGQTYFLEINFRSSAWLYAFKKAGVNLPYMYAKSILQNQLDVSSENIKKLPFSLMFSISDFNQNVLTKKVSLWRWLRDFLSTDCFFMYNRRDVKPFLVKVYNYLRH